MRLLAHLLGQAFDHPDMNMMALSATNRLQGVIVKLDLGEVMSKVVIEVAPDVHVGSVITTDSVKRLGLRVGGRAMAVIKATEVLVAAQVECQSEYEDDHED
jgi:molybdopterin-binding protein